jgi:hypothetical protein
MIDKVFDTPAPKDNFIGYWYENDCLLNIHNEVIFSVLGRYNCFAGCEVCYTQKHFKEALPNFKKFILSKISKEQEEQWFEIFDHFATVSNIDDLFWMKTEQTHLYDWYKKHSHRFAWGSMTDNNFIRTQPLFMNELSSDTKIQEISFSDSWLEKIKIKEIMYMLEELQKRNGIGKIKFILTQKDAMDITNVKKLWEWIQQSEIEYSCSHHDFKGNTQKIISEIPQAEHIASYDSDIYPVCRESNYLQNNGFFLTLTGAIDTVNKPYYSFEANFDSQKHLSDMVQGKIDLYKTWAYSYQQGKIKDDGAGKNYFDYFKWVSTHVKVNKDYNFIPIDLLNAKHKYYHKLVELGWTITDYGLAKNTKNGIKPLIGIVDGRN